MKTKLFILIVCLLSLLSFGCNRDKEVDGCYTYNFGTVRYPQDPFIGIIKNRPQILEKSIDIVPYKWCVRKEANCSERRFDICFNTGAFEAKSQSGIIFGDANGLPYSKQDLLVQINGINQESARPLQAEDGEQSIKVKISVNPKLKDTVFHGKIAFVSQNLDIINHDTLSEPTTLLYGWTIQQKAGSRFWLYFLWILTLVILILLLFILSGAAFYLVKWGGKGLTDFLRWVGSLIKRFFIFLWITIVAFFSWLREKVTRDTSKRQEKKKKKQEKQKQKQKQKQKFSKTDTPRILLVSDYVYTSEHEKDVDTIYEHSRERYLNYEKREKGVDYEPYYRMYRNIEWMFKGFKMTNAEKEIFWENDNIELYHYVRTPIKYGKKPTKEDYQNGIGSFQEELQAFTPDYIVILGKTLDNMTNISPLNSHVIRVASPSWMFFNRGLWHNTLKNRITNPLSDYYRENYDQ